MTISPRGDARQPLGLLRVGAGHDEALAADPDIGAEDRAEGGRRPPELERDADLLPIVRPRPPYSSGMDRPNSPISRISRTISSGTSSSLGDLLLERPQPLGDEAADRLDQRVEGFGVEGHQ